MKLDDNQKAEVIKWISEGADIARVQSLLSEKFGISMRYMDVRFLVDDLGAQVVDKPEPKVQKEQTKSSSPDTDDAAAIDNAAAEFNSDTPVSEGNMQPVADNNVGVGNISVTLSPIQRPGAIASGDAVFSDGGKAEWVLDQGGRLGLIPAVQGYNPPSADMQPFQRKLMELLGQM